jgi:uncharacterized membrane protein
VRDRILATENWTPICPYEKQKENVRGNGLYKILSVLGLIQNPFVPIIVTTMRATKTIYTVLVVLTGIWCAGILAAPYFLHSSATGEARELYAFFSRVCHQQDARSFHLCGEKFGVCIRCTALYFSFFAGLLLYPVVRSLRHLSLPSHKFLLAIAAPMVLDVCLNLAGLVHSTTLSRVITGTVFGFFAPWFILPPLVEAVHQLKSKKKISRTGEVEYVGKTR